MQKCTSFLNLKTFFKKFRFVVVRTKQREYLYIMRNTIYNISELQNYKLEMAAAYNRGDVEAENIAWNKIQNFVPQTQL